MHGCPSCAPAIERNARLVHALKKRTAELHQINKHRDQNWYRCSDPLCLAMFELIENHLAPHRGSTR